MVDFSGTQASTRTPDPRRPDLRARLARVRRRVLRHRRGIAVTLVALAVYLAVQAATAAPPARVPTWVAARDLPSGTVLTTGDLTEVGFAPDSVPGSAIEDPKAVLGRSLAAPLGKGVPLTDGSVVGEGWLRDRAGLAAVPVRITDPAVAGLLSVGDTVRLVSTDPDTPGRAETLAEQAVVLAIPAASAASDSSLTGCLILFGVPDTDASDVATVAAARYVSVVWNR